jgi:hypothetical protein
LRNLANTKFDQFVEQQGKLSSTGGKRTKWQEVAGGMY